ncbi:hypothetical protein WJX82_006210 [Trebouxia sp. C0006]
MDNQAYIVLNLLPGSELDDAFEAKIQQPYDHVWMQHLAQQLCTKVDMLGTFEYMSPEVLQGMARKWSKQDVKGQSYDAAAADVWSVGAVLYGAATGQPLLNRFDSPARMADAEINEHELSWDDLQYMMQCQTELLEDNMAGKWTELAERTTPCIAAARNGAYGEAVPGMGSVFWAPKSHYLYATVPGNVLRWALQDLQKAKFIPSTAFSFANNVHFSLYRLPGGEIKFLCQEVDDRRAESQPDQQHAFKDTARQLFEMLEGLHAKKAFVGAVQPERILVEPTFCLAECCPGDWLETVSTMQRLAPEVLLKADRGGYTPQEFSSAEGGRTLASQDVLPQEERTELFKNVLGQLCRYEAEGFRAEELKEELMQLKSSQCLTVLQSGTHMAMTAPQAA